MSAAHPSRVMSACIAKPPRRRGNGTPIEEDGGGGSSNRRHGWRTRSWTCLRSVRSFEIREPRQRKFIAAGPLTPMAAEETGLRSRDAGGLSPSDLMDLRSVNLGAGGIGVEARIFLDVLC